MNREDEREEEKGRKGMDEGGKLRERGGRGREGSDNGGGREEE